MPRFSIVTPCWNASETLETTIRSVLAQDFGDWEWIIIDDGSTDATPSLLTSWAKHDSRIRVVQCARNGPSGARNIGAFDYAEGELIAFLDSDDLWPSDRLSILAAQFSRSEAADAIYGRVAFFRQDPEKTDAVSSVPRGQLSAEAFLGENPVCTMSNLTVRASLFRTTGGFNPDVRHNEDIEWLVRAAASGVRIQGIDQILTLYRASRFGLSANIKAMRESRQVAVDTARRRGEVSSERLLTRANALHLRYLARRALRTGAPGSTALRLAAEGIATSPRAFFDDPVRGAATLLGALIAPVLPRSLHPRLFS